MEPLLAALRNSASVNRFQDWGLQYAVEYRGMFSAESFGGSGDAHELADYGWTTTALTLANGSAADLPDAGWSTLDWGTPGSCTLADASDVLLSPAVFADPMGFLAAARLLGSSRPPRTFFLEVLAAFTTETNNETGTGFGLVEDGGSPITAADHFAFVVSNGTNFILRNGAAATLTGAAVDSALHFHRIVIDRIDQVIYWYMSSDGVTWTQQGTSLALEADELPLAFGAGVQVAGGNDVVLYGMVRAGYI